MTHAVQARDRNCHTRSIPRILDIVARPESLTHGAATSPAFLRPWRFSSLEISREYRDLLFAKSSTFARGVLVIDGVGALPGHDYIDIGDVVEGTGAVAVVVKSLLYGDGRRWILTPELR